MQPKPVPERRVELCELRIIDTDESGFEPGDPGRCAFRMYAKPPRAKLLRVFVGGGEREHGRTDDGWVYDPTSATVTLLGAACEEANGSTTVRIESQCETLKLI